MKLPVNYWLETIADDKIRKSALDQMDDSKSLVDSLSSALFIFTLWVQSKEGGEYWRSLRQLAKDGALLQRDYITPDRELIFTAAAGVWTKLSEPDPLTTHIYEVTKAIELLKNEGYLIFKPNSNL